ncbi:MAG: hypothetical protein GY952_11495 [Rhodobacteraceae bacterium]|nr:hypothetical protein [Paracoccaceae bacterium]
MLQTNDPIFDPISRQYHADMLALATAAINARTERRPKVAGRSGRFSQSTYRQAQAELATATTHATLLLSGADMSHSFVKEFWKEQQRIINASSWKIARDVANGRYSFDKLKNRPVTELVEARLDLWTHSLGRVWHLGLIAPSAKKFTYQLQWLIGKTEKHCNTCLGNNGRIKSKQFWFQLAIKKKIYPQGPGLECGGWRCDCRFKKVI